MTTTYDVFVSFKNLDNRGRPSRDSVIARQIHSSLTALGISVFYSETSLEKKGISEYKLYIDKALDAAKIIVVVGTSIDNMESKWVRYEWDSFFNDILSGVKPEGRVFTYVEGMDMKSLPRSLRQTQTFQHAPETLDRLRKFVAHSLGLSENVDSLDLDHDILQRGAAFRVSPNLELIQDDILNSSGGLLICTVNTSLIMSDGLQRKVRKLVGMRLQINVLKYMFRFPLGQVRILRGNERWPYIAMVNSAGSPLGRRAKTEEGVIAGIVFTTLQKAQALNLRSICSPLLGSGFGKLDDEKSFDQIRIGLKKYMREYPSNSTLAKLYIREPERFIRLRLYAEREK